MKKQIKNFTNKNGSRKMNKKNKDEMTCNCNQCKKMKPHFGQYRPLTKVEAYKALKNKKNNYLNDDTTIDDLLDFSNFATDGTDVYSIDESNYSDWLPIAEID